MKDVYFLERKITGYGGGWSCESDMDILGEGVYLYAALGTRRETEEIIEKFHKEILPHTKLVNACDYEYDTNYFIQITEEEEDIALVMLMLE